MIRSSGILLHITSLPSPYGVGNLGAQAREFVDFLARAKQHYWQILPLSPTGYGDSPYQSASAFAGNPYLIDPDTLLAEGLLLPAELAIDWGNDPEQTDYGLLYENRFSVLRRAFARFSEREQPEFVRFCESERAWLDDYALFMALKARFSGKPWTEWDADLRLRRPAALARCRRELAEEIAFQKWMQFEFFREWDLLHTYARAHGVSIIGDIPIYVPLDSADVWSKPQNFQLNRLRRPRVVAGCPPDGFSADGQLWGNPIYDWKRMEAEGFPWWTARIRAAARCFDVVRIDHFRGIESYWAIPAHAKSARSGTWIPGPGMALIDAIRRTCPETQFIAEDLGFLTEGVRRLVADSGFPGMKVLEFAFDSREPSNYLPDTYAENAVCYTGTHDNPTLRQWYQECRPEDLAAARRYLNIGEDADLCEALIRLGMRCRANLFMVQMQDYLGLDGRARMNVPGVLARQNWRWRMRPGAASPELADHIAILTEEGKRS